MRPVVASVMTSSNLAADKSATRKFLFIAEQCPLCPMMLLIVMRLSVLLWLLPTLAAASPIVLHDVTVIDGTGASAQPHTDVVLDGTVSSPCSRRATTVPPTLALWRCAAAG